METKLHPIPCSFIFSEFKKEPERQLELDKVYNIYDWEVIISDKTKNGIVKEFNIYHMFGNDDGINIFYYNKNYYPEMGSSPKDGFLMRMESPDEIFIASHDVKIAGTLLEHLQKKEIIQQNEAIELTYNDHWKTDKFGTIKTSRFGDISGNKFLFYFSVDGKKVLPRFESYFRGKYYLDADRVSIF